MSPGSHVLIDGYNVIFCSGECARGAPSVEVDQAKTQMIRSAGELCDRENLQVTLVFDGKGRINEIEHPLRDEFFTVVHSSSQGSADAVLERMLSKSRKPDQMLLVSDDRLIQSAALAVGATTMSVSAFVDWLDGTRKSGDYRKPKKSNQSGDQGFNTIPL
jgi:predicted RNA-binding protein with PIN domain